MDVDSDNEALNQIAAGGPVQEGTWPALRADIIARLDKIAHNDFPIPNLPPPPPPLATLTTRMLSPLPSSPLEHTSAREGNKENAPADRPTEAEARPLAPGELPKQIDDMLAGINKHLETFGPYAPHTIQRLAELILKPRAHYKALASYLHAVDRVVRVTSGTDVYPLPPAIPDMSSMQLNGGEERDPAAAVSWRNPTAAALGTDEALGGALLTPIPWLTRRSPEGNGDTPTSSSAAQIHSESTETIDGPNGMGRIETVSVSVNGIPSTGHTRGVTQGELLRQEQRAGVVPVSQLNRGLEPTPSDDQDGERERDRDRDTNMPDQEDEVPHARGPEEIGISDTGLQAATATTSYMGEDGVSVQAIDVEAAVGRKHDEHEHERHGDDNDGASSTSSVESTGTKREADQVLEAETPKKLKEDDASAPGDADAVAGSTSSAAMPAESAESAAAGDAGKVADGGVSSGDAAEG